MTRLGVVAASDLASQRLLTPREVADMLRVSPSMVRALTRRGELAAVYIGRLPRYSADAVATYLARAAGGGE